MKSRELAMRAMRQEAEERRRKVEDLERIIQEFQDMAADLERQIKLEEDRTGIRDPEHFSYSTFANAAAQRRDKLRTSMQGLRDQLQVALCERDESAERLAKATVQSEGRDNDRARNGQFSQRSERQHWPA